MSSFYGGALIALGGALGGVVLGALLEWWRDDTRWKRDEQVRWTSDLRVLYRDLLASGDEFFRRLDHTRRLESRMKREPDMSEPEAERVVAKFTESLDVMQRELETVNAITADVQLIGSKEEADATSAFAIQVLAGSVLPSNGDFRQLKTQYNAAKREVIEVARASLRRT